MDNVHGLRDFNMRMIRMYIERIEFQCRRPNHQSLFLNYSFDIMRSIFVWKKWRNWMTKCQNRKYDKFKKASLFFNRIFKHRSCYFWRVLERVSDFLCKRMVRWRHYQKIQMNYFLMTKSNDKMTFALNPITRVPITRVPITRVLKMI